MLLRSNSPQFRRRYLAGTGKKTDLRSVGEQWIEQAGARRVSALHTRHVVRLRRRVYLRNKQEATE